MHVRDVWSKQANPTLGTMDNRPSAVVLTDTSNAWLTYSARHDSANCDWYSTCMSLSTAGMLVMSAQGPACQKVVRDRHPECDLDGGGDDQSDVPRR